MVTYKSTQFIQFGLVQLSSVRRSATQLSTFPFSSVQPSSVQPSRAIQFSPAKCSSVLLSAVRTLLHSAEFCFSSAQCIPALFNSTQFSSFHPTSSRCTHNSIQFNADLFNSDQVSSYKSTSVESSPCWQSVCSAVQYISVQIRRSLEIG